MFSDVWSDNAVLFERLIGIHSNPPILSFLHLNLILYDFAIVVLIIATFWWYLLCTDKHLFISLFTLFSSSLSSMPSLSPLSSPWLEESPSRVSASPPRLALLRVADVLRRRRARIEDGMGGHALGVDQDIVGHHRMLEGRGVVYVPEVILAKGTWKTTNFLNLLQTTVLPYFGKRKQVTKLTFLVKEQNVSFTSTDVNGISWCLTQQLLAGWVLMHKNLAWKKSTLGKIQRHQ